ETERWMQIANAEVDDGMKFQQAFIHRAKFFRGERTVVHTRKLSGVRLTEKRELRECGEQRPVIEFGGLQRTKSRRRKQLTTKPADSERCARTVRLEKAEGAAQT